ncbi:MULTISPECIES: ABC transporter permease [Sphaerochaeta]|jgi:NitT/TauT family transport system permease protein|uniref:ABC transporter permease n=1 Tax=Sphaerochaeta TaxID=399320 RepID=UPI0025856F52|nr:MULTISPECIES: ABC transporter permease [Sphaerochaeta]MDD3424612.1 ABC transporter permease [Sphaerochaeta sp.]MDD3457208.1 ABC transporter permease [Sphaerochaeta sp.]MDD4038451.1 ABC transporter permease [Sphaerochaeta sp.]MDD4450996.1 ABC transporter permease [Sphaerochaeta sp.]MDX9983811.1 ABC transporter permease [Sphaerochaeta sp.]
MDSTASEQSRQKARKLKDFSDGTKRYRYTLMVVSIIGGFLLWAVITLIPTINTFLASPKQVFAALIAESMANGRYFKDISISLQRVLVGFGLAFICSIPVSFLMGWYPTVRNLVEPWIQFMRTIPPIALIPLVILAMGLGEPPKYTIIFVAAFLVMVVTIYQGVKEVDKTLIRAAYTFGASDKDLFFDIVIPASFPYILVGARLGMAASLTTLIAAELTGTTFGLGARIQGAQQFMDTSIVLLGIITIGIIGFVLDKILLLIEKKLTKWK